MKISGYHQTISQHSTREIIEEDLKACCNFRHPSHLGNKYFGFEINDYPLLI